MSQHRPKGHTIRPDDGVTPAALPVEGLVTRPLDLVIPFCWGVVTPETQPVSALLEQLINQLEAIPREALPPSNSLRQGPKGPGTP